MSQEQTAKKEEPKEPEGQTDATSSCLFTFDTHPYFPFLFDPYSSSKYGSQVRERKIDRCLKQLQEALKSGK